MAKKFDTNPLDPDFPNRVAETQTAETVNNLNNQTRVFAPAPPTEEQTQRFNDAQYQPMYEPRPYQPPALYQTSRLADYEQPIDRKVDKIGIAENILVALPYLPWGIGLIAGLVELLVVPKSEAKTRFHAAQGLALSIGVLLISAVLGVVDNISDWASVGTGLFQLAVFVAFIYWTIQAYKGKPIHVEAVDDLTNWLEEKVRLK